MLWKIFVELKYDTKQLIPFLVMKFEMYLRLISSSSIVQFSAILLANLSSVIMASTSQLSKPKLPFPISCVSSNPKRYMLFDIDVITWLRREHHILGVLIGSLPQVPQQNVFLGLPLDLLTEEARLLVEKGIAYIVDDQKWHQGGFEASRDENLRIYQDELTRQGMEAAKTTQMRKAMRKSDHSGHSRLGSSNAGRSSSSVDPSEDSETLFGTVESQSPRPSLSALTAGDTKPLALTPATTYPPIPAPPPEAETELPAVDASSYAVFRHLHEKGYYMTPGLRFGCQYTAYPGDTLRYHSHFLVLGMNWDKKIDLQHLLGGGRLGTGVKKGFLLGGPQPANENQELERVRTFCVEWAGM